MARIITVPALKEHIETDLGEAALQRLIDDADQAVVDRYGVHGSATDTLTEEVDGGERFVFLRRSAASISSVTEYTTGTTNRTLAAGDYRLRFGGRALERLTTGDTPASVWGYRVDVAYLVATDENVRRRRVVIDLVKLAMKYDALKSEQAGDYRSQSVDYQDERERLITELGRSSGGVRLHV